MYCLAICELIAYFHARDINRIIDAVRLTMSFCCFCRFACTHDRPASCPQSDTNREMEMNKCSVGGRRIDNFTIHHFIESTCFSPCGEMIRLTQPRPTPSTVACTTRSDWNCDAKKTCENETNRVCNANKRGKSINDLHNHFHPQRLLEIHYSEAVAILRFGSKWPWYFTLRELCLTLLSCADVAHMLSPTFVPRRGFPSVPSPVFAKLTHFANGSQSLRNRFLDRRPLVNRR